MSYLIRVENREIGSFLTTRSRNSELWFINNSKLENEILSFAAKYKTRYGVKLFALAIQGNHIHIPALFPNANRAEFMRDFNSSVARAIPRFCPTYKGGRFWGRRYSSEFLPAAEDIEEYFFYTVLQPIKDGLVDKISQYPGYNCFHDAIWGVKRKFKVVKWKEYRDARRFNKRVKLCDFTEVVTLEYERIPGYDHLTQSDYAKLMMEKYEARRKLILEKRLGEGKKCVGRNMLNRVKPGTIPLNTKRSDRNAHRPRVLSISNERRAVFKAWYFEICFSYKESSLKYRRGDIRVEFPQGTYKPLIKVPILIE
jgi:REP element-mobilizing transposase RayT